MSITNLSKAEIIDILQITECERDDYDILVNNNIIPTLDVSMDEFKHLDIDMYHRVICRHIREMKEEIEILKKYKKKIHNIESKYIVVYSGDDGCDVNINF